MDPVQLEAECDRLRDQWAREFRRANEAEARECRLIEECDRLRALQASAEQVAKAEGTARDAKDAELRDLRRLVVGLQLVASEALGVSYDAVRETGRARADDYFGGSHA